MNGNSQHNHLKIIIQIKPYKFEDIDNLYKGLFIPIINNPVSKEVNAVFSWFTVKNLTFNYIYEWNIQEEEQKQKENEVEIEVVDYSGFRETFNINSDTINSRLWTYD